MDYNKLVNELSHQDLYTGMLDLLEKGFTPTQLNILRILKSVDSGGTDRDVNFAVEQLVHVRLGNFVGSTYGDTIESREDIPTREQTIASVLEALMELK